MKTASHILFRNWAGNVKIQSDRLFYPENEQDIIDVINQSLKNKACLRPMGSRHSWSRVLDGAQYLISLREMNKVIYIDKEKKQIRVEAGIRLNKIHKVLDSVGLAMCNLGSISEQSLAGAIATGTHGTGISYSILASQVESFRIIQADGIAKELHKERDAEEFCRALVSMGMAGVITEITLNVCDAFQLREEAKLIPFPEVMKHLDRWVSETDHLKIWWFPHQDDVMVYRYTRTKDPVNDSAFRKLIDDSVLSQFVFGRMLALGKNKSSRRPAINRFIRKFFLKNLNRVEKSHRVFNVSMPPLHHEAEYAFNASDAVKALTEWKRRIEANGHMVNFVVEARWVKGDDFDISPCFGRDSCFIGAYLAGDADWENFLSDFESMAMELGARPHWGKEFSVPSNYLQSIYPRFQSFRNHILEKDPHGLFRNNWLRGMFD